MIELTEHQVEVLTILANSKKQIAAFASTEEDLPEAAKTIDQNFADQMMLVTYGLVTDVTERPGYKKISDTYMKEEKRVLRVLVPTEMSKRMFKRSSKAVN